MARIIETIEADPELSGLYALCPADSANSARPLSRYVFGDTDLDLEVCEEDPASCFSACTDGKSGDACFTLARAMQENEPEEEAARYYEGLFTRACMLGEAAGCTNRAAGIRNGGYADDPFVDVAEAERGLCTFRSFKAGCDGDDAWGCAMLGQAYHYGEGTEIDLNAAVAASHKACEPDPDFVACDFAQETIQAAEDERSGAE